MDIIARVSWRSLTDKGKAGATAITTTPIKADSASDAEEKFGEYLELNAKKNGYEILDVAYYDLEHWFDSFSRTY
jgi:hypothetical protein